MDAQLTEQVLFDAARLRERAQERAEAYRTARPFPHAVFDDFLPETVARAAVAEVDEVARDRMDLYTDAGNTRKLATSDESVMGPVTRQLIAQFNSKAMIDFLETLTGMEGLVPDPHLVGGGIHVLESGGFLRVHADFNQHRHLKLDRRINVLLYLNPDWQEVWGGNLELWNGDMSECQARIVPLLNRVAVFNVTDRSFHGNPAPVASPDGAPRRSLAFYYYTNGRPAEERSDPHSTLYQTPGVRPDRSLLRRGLDKATRAFSR